MFNEYDDNTSEKLFIVAGLSHHYPMVEDLETPAALNLEVLGSYTDFKDALTCKSMYEDIDKTLESITIFTTDIRENAPRKKVMLNITVTQDGVFVRSTLEDVDSKPYACISKNEFYVIANPHEQDIVVDNAIEYYMERSGGEPPQIFIDISEKAKKMMEKSGGGK